MQKLYLRVWRALYAFENMYRKQGSVKKKICQLSEKMARRNKRFEAFVTFKQCIESLLNLVQ